MNSGWSELRDRGRAEAVHLCSPLPAGTGPPGTGLGHCLACRGPVRPGYARCYQCDLHEQAAHGCLADAVVPISYAVKGTCFAAGLWQYKSGLDAARRVRAGLRALLLIFLRDHGGCVWRQAGMPTPTHLAVVPSGSGRPGPHPAWDLVSPYLRLSRVTLSVRPGAEPAGRELNPGRLRATGLPPGGDVLLVDDTWVSGASAQSAAVALKRAGARRVAVVVLGRHVNPADPNAGPLARSLEIGRFDQAWCAVHEQAAEQTLSRRPG
jgi:hypothetical protein